MIKKTEIWNALLKAENKARSGKLNKLLRNPVLYPSLLLFNYVLYPLYKRGVLYSANTFFSTPFRTFLPSGTDVALHGIKSHDSEIRLSKYLVRELKEGDVFIDIGAHFGYYTLLASALVGNEGKVYSIEASATSYRVLIQNTSSAKNIESFNAAAGEREGVITFYEYPGPYAEYNTTIPGAYTGENWYKNIREKINVVPLMELDNLFAANGIENAILKIDVEGGEVSVLQGLKTTLGKNQLKIALEYLISNQNESAHMKAAQLLFDAGYRSHVILEDGCLQRVENIDDYLHNHGRTSDNIVFMKDEL